MTAGAEGLEVISKSKDLEKPKQAGQINSLFRYMTATRNYLICLAYVGSTNMEVHRPLQPGETAPNGIHLPRA